jgi:hypothetical protein
MAAAEKRLNYELTRMALNVQFYAENGKATLAYACF